MCRGKVEESGGIVGGCTKCNIETKDKQMQEKFCSPNNVSKWGRCSDNVQ